jgi:uncharacterized membrane protein
MINFAVLNLIDNSKANLPEAKDNAVQTVLTDLFVLMGALAFFMIVLAGLRYILARGSPDKVESAKNQIMYALIGLVIAILAATIVNLVLGRASS